MITFSRYSVKHVVRSECFAGRPARMTEVEDTIKSLHRTSPGPATVCRNSNVVRELRQRSATSRADDIDRRVSEIERLVKLAEECSVDAERRQPARTTSPTTIRPVRRQTDDSNSHSQRQRLEMRDAILLPVTKATTAVSSTDSRRARDRRQGRRSPITLSQLLDVKSMDRCPKCHKVRLDAGSSDTRASANWRRQRSGRNSARLVRFKTVDGNSPTTDISTDNSRSRKTSKQTDDDGAKTRASTNSTSRYSSISTIPSSRDRNHDQDQGRQIQASTVVPSEDTNNNYNSEPFNTSEHCTWPRKAADSKLTGDNSATSPGDQDARRSGRSRYLGSRKRPSLSAVQQLWAEQSTQRPTIADSEVDNNSPPSAASSYDALDTAVDNSTGRRSVTFLLLVEQE